MTHPNPSRPPATPALALCALAIAQLTIGLDYNIVFVALPDISAGIGFDPHALQWTISAYTITFGGFLLLGGRCSDLVGRRRMLHTGLALYALGSLIGGLAHTPTLLLTGRAVQGLGGAVLAPATLSLITTTFAEGPARNRALGIWGAAGSSGMVLGSLLGGVLTEWFGWRSVFFVNLPIVAVVMVLASLSIAEDKNPPVSLRSFDLSGALTITAASSSLVLALTQGPSAGWGSPVTVVSGVSAAVFTIAFVIIENHSRNPLVPLRTFRYRNLTLGTGITFVFMATLGALPYFLTNVLQDAFGYTPLKTGIAFILPCACVLIGTVIGGRLASGIGLRATLTAAMVVAGLGILLFAAALRTDGSFAGLAPGLAIFSVAQGVIFTSMFAAATTGLPDAEQGLASGVASSGQQLGGAVGLAILVVVASRTTDMSSTATTIDGARAASIAAALAIIAAAGLGLAIRSRSHSSISTETSDPADCQAR